VGSAEIIVSSRLCNAVRSNMVNYSSNTKAQIKIVKTKHREPSRGSFSALADSGVGASRNEDKVQSENLPNTVSFKIF
jgi:hypothetical protein